MWIDYVSSAMEEKDFSELFKNCNQKPGQQAQKYNRLMMEGLAANGIKVKAVTSRPITSKNCMHNFLKSSNTIRKNLIYHYCTTINIPLLKVLCQFAITFFNVVNDLKVKDSLVIIDVLNASIAYGAVLAAKLRKKRIVGIVTDLPELMVTGNNKRYIKLVNKVIGKCTDYVFLTKSMNDVINPNQKPFVVIEGLCDINMSLKEYVYKASTPKVCIYAGLLDERYGVKTMVEAFESAQVKNSELHIYGSGPYVPELMEVVKNNKNIIYKGVVMNKEVVNAELEATLLINPRPTNEEFTKFSFPSKNMEYMVSGTPVLTTNLPGMPKEYREHVFLFDGETKEAMADKIRDVLNKSEEELFNKGMNAKKFVLQEKNNVVQALKIIELCKER